MLLWARTPVNSSENDCLMCVREITYIFIVFFHLAKLYHNYRRVGLFILRLSVTKVCLKWCNFSNFQSKLKKFGYVVFIWLATKPISQPSAKHLQKKLLTLFYFDSPCMYKCVCVCVCV